jgi:fatty acid desaturase
MSKEKVNQRMEQIMEFSKTPKFGLSKDEKREFREKFEQKSTPKGVTLILLTHLSIIASALIVVDGINSPELLYSIILTLVGIIFISRQLRALENIVHFGSHYNITKGNKNDIIINILAAWPVLQDVRNYRKSHMIHHSRYGASADPCRIRYDRLKHLFSSRSWLDKAKGVLVYYKNFYQDFGFDLNTLVRFLIAHALCFGIITLCLGLSTAQSYYILMAVCFFFVLPLIRMVAELGEHDYDISEDVLESTYTNVSLLDRLIFHPAGDAYHVLHHVHPTIPWWNQRKAHDYLVKSDHYYSTAPKRDGIFPRIAS